MSSYMATGMVLLLKCIESLEEIMTESQGVLQFHLVFIFLSFLLIESKEGCQSEKNYRY